VAFCCPVCFQCGRCSALASFIALPSQPLVEWISCAAVFLLLSPVVIFLHLCNLSGLNSNPCVLFGRYYFPDLDICCPNEIVIVHLRSDFSKDEGTLVEELPARQFLSLPLSNCSFHSGTHDDCICSCCTYEKALFGSLCEKRTSYQHRTWIYSAFA